MSESFTVACCECRPSYHSSVDNIDDDDASTLEFAWRPFRENVLSWAFYLVFGIIHPEGLFRQGWDSLISMVLLYVCVRLPYFLAFQVSDYSSDCPPDWPGFVEPELGNQRNEQDLLWSFDFAIDVLFFMDILYAAPSVLLFSKINKMFFWIL